jgi:hypothetical protein
MDLAASLHISAAEITYSLQRSAQAGLLDFAKEKPMCKTILEFIQFGLPYVFPAIRGPVQAGIPTAYSAPVMRQLISTNEKLVWPHPDGKIRAESIEPLYPNAVKAALSSQEVYDLLALLDGVRTGKVREKQVAMKLLTEKFSLANA